MTDTLAPTITINVATQIRIEQGAEYVKAGVSATDIVDDAVTVIMTGVVVNELGDVTP